MKKFILFVRRKPLGDETSLTRDTSCEVLNIWTRKPSVQKVVKRTAGQAGIVCGANIRRDVKISHSAVKQKVLNVSSGITVLRGGEDVNETHLKPLPQFDNLGYRLDDCQKVNLNDQVCESEKMRIGLLVLADKNNPEFQMFNEYEL